MKIVTLLSNSDTRVLQVWLMEDNRTLVRPHIEGTRLKGNFRILGQSDVVVWYDQVWLECEVFTSNKDIILGVEDEDPPVQVKLYQEFMNVADAFMTQTWREAVENLSKTREIHTEPENTEESSDTGDSPEVGCETRPLQED